MMYRNFGRRFGAAAMAAGLAGSLTAPSLLAQQTKPQVYRVSSFDSSSRSFIGVGIAEIDSERAKVLKLNEERGVEITRVDDDSPASAAGLKTGDVVLEYNGQRVEGMDQFARFVRETPVGREAKLGISRGGKPQIISVKVASRKTGGLIASMPRTIEIPEIRIPDFPRGVAIWSSAVLGIDCESVDGQLAEFFGVKEGVLVRSVSKGSSAEKAGLRAGDVLTKVDGAAVDSPSDVSRAMRAAIRSKKSVQLVIVRDKKEMTLTAPIEETERGEFRRLNRRNVRFDSNVSRF